MDHTVILFYKYTTIREPEKLRKKQERLCGSLNLSGRLIIAEEGINGTLEGENKKIDEYIQIMCEDERFVDVDFKTSEGTGNAFPGLSVKVRPEIVSSYMNKEIDPQDGGEYVFPERLHNWFEEGEEFTVLDMRNDYEIKSGKFEKTRHPGMSNFREIRKDVDNIKDLKDKKVVAVCTGGIRCEKATAYLKSRGFTDVHQLRGGIHRYLEKYPDGYFKGTLYVFDGRMTVDLVDEIDREIMGECEFCGKETEQYVDDDSVTPSRQLLCCDNCFKKRENNLRLAKSTRD